MTLKISSSESSKLCPLLNLKLHVSQLISSVLAQRLVVAGEDAPSLVFHEPIWWQFACLGESSHFRAGNEQKVFRAFRVEECHLVDCRIVSGDTERKDFDAVKPRRHLQDAAAMRVVIEVAVRVHRLVRVRHARRVTSDDVKVGAGDHP